MSLRSRLLVGFAIIIALLVALGVAVTYAQHGALIDQLDERLVAIAPFNPIPPGQARDRPEPPEGAARPDPFAPLESQISDVYIARVDTDGQIDVALQGELLATVPNLSSVMGSPPVERETVTLPASDGGGTFRAIVHPAGDGATGVVAVPADDVDQTVNRLALTLLGVGSAIAAVLAALAWWVWRLGLRPIIDMTSTAEAIASGDRSQRVKEVDPGTEAGQLARSLNTMLDQRDATDNRLRQFVSDASHELRTPLTSLRGYVELYEAGGFHETDQVDDAMRRIGGEADRMHCLVENLLSLARLDQERPLDVAPTDVGELVRDIAASAMTANPSLDLTVAAPAKGALLIELDQLLVTQVIAGLVDNAVTHAPDAAVTLRASINADERLEISVADDGPGLTCGEAARVFDRFYRGDASRSRSRGGTGLGLAIAAQIAARHDGRIDLRTAPGEGADFTLVIPTGHPPRGPAT